MTSITLSYFDPAATVETHTTAPDDTVIVTRQQVQRVLALTPDADNPGYYRLAFGGRQGDYGNVWYPAQHHVSAADLDALQRALAAVLPLSPRLPRGERRRG